MNVKFLMNHLLKVDDLLSVPMYEFEGLEVHIIMIMNSYECVNVFNTEIK